jgi:hypothetical protein
VITVPNPRKDPKFLQNLRPIRPLSTTDEIFERVILKIVKRHIEERGLINASQLDFRVRQSTTLQYMRLTKHVTLNFNNNMSTAAVFFDIEKPLILHGKLACYIIYLNCNFQPVRSSLFLRVFQYCFGAHPASGALSPRLKLPGCEAYLSPQASSVVKKMWIYTSTPTYSFMA